jgi:hypothetical protein
MGWNRIHKTVNANGGVSINTGHSKEEVKLLDWSGGANNGVKVRTSSIDIPIKGDILVLMEFSTSMPATDCWIRIEHSDNGTDWYSTAQHTVTARSSTTAGTGEDISKINFMDMSLIDAADNRYFFLYDIETHGMAKYTRFALELDDNSDHSSDTVTFALLPHNF